MPRPLPPTPTTSSRVFRWLAPALVGLLLAACSTTPAPTSSNDELNTLRHAPMVAPGLERHSEPLPSFLGPDGGLERHSLTPEALPPLPGMSTNGKNAKSDGAAAAGDSLVLAHYMPWYQTPDVSGYWGMHWTMARCNPEVVREDGRRDICARHYPLIGPYDSVDDDVLEYHILLMKLSGIDGILIDWYGVIDAFDWGVLRRATDRIVERFDEAGLSVGIVYEDKTLTAAQTFGLIDDDIAAGQEVMRYLKAEYFSRPNYLRLGGRPVLLNFGPQHFWTADAWREVLSAAPSNPHYVGLGWVEGVSSSAFPWIEWPQQPNYLENYFAWAEAAGVPFTVGAAYPGFHDYYREGGWGDNLFYLDPLGGERFAQTLATNAAHAPEIIQLDTWNDFGEGTTIEPTVEYGYRYLEDLQAFTGVPYDVDDLKLVTRLFELRKAHADDARIQRRLDNAAKLLERGNTRAAEAALQGIR